MAFTPDMAVVMGVSALVLALFVFEALSPDIVALLAVLAVLVTGVAEPKGALAGFANPAVHTIAAMFVISAGLLKTGVVESFGRQLIRVGGGSPTLAFVLTLIAVVILSAFINNTPVVVMMIPVALGASRAHGFPVSKFLIPISYASIFGGCCTLIGTSTNLVVSGLSVDAGLAPISMFEMAPLGLVFAVVGILYLALFSRRLLPSREPVTSDVSPERIREFVTEFVVQPDSPLIGQDLAETAFQPGGDLRALQVIRGETIHWPPFAGIEIKSDDILIVKGPANDILAEARSSGVKLVPDIDADGPLTRAASHTLAFHPALIGGGVPRERPGVDGDAPPQERLQGAPPCTMWPGRRGARLCGGALPLGPSTRKKHQPEERASTVDSRGRYPRTR